MSDELIFKEECFKIIGLCMKVHSILGPGFKEIIYKDAIEIELQRERISYVREKSFRVNYEGVILPRRFDVDFMVYDNIVLEIKATPFIHYQNFKQTLNYLKASEIKLGILINFGTNRLEFQRIVCTNKSSA
jgi:GxxExxY protein